VAFEVNVAAQDLSGALWPYTPTCAQYSDPVYALANPNFIVIFIVMGAMICMTVAIVTLAYKRQQERLKEAEVKEEEAEALNPLAVSISTTASFCRCCGLLLLTHLATHLASFPLANQTISVKNEKKREKMEKDLDLLKKKEDTQGKPAASRSLNALTALRDSHTPNNWECFPTPCS
jgi:hypothetical protein